MPDPRIIQVQEFGAGGPLHATRQLTDAEQLMAVTSLLNDLYRASLPTNDPLYLELTPVALDQHSSALMDWAQYTPDLVSSVRDHLSSQYGFNPSTSPDANTVAGDIFNRLSSTLETSTTTSTTEQGITRTGTESQDRTTGRRVTRYVDVPTPEEFLNDFQNALSTRIRAMRTDGSIDRSTEEFLTDNPNLLLDRYIADLGARAVRGEDIFRVVGVTGPNEHLGARPGEAEVSQYSGQTRQQIYEQIATSQRDQITSEVTNTYTAANGGAPLTADQQQQVHEETDRRINEITNRLVNETIQQSGTETTLTAEEVISRPHLTTVFKFSPTDFLKTNFTPESLMNLAAGQRGTEQARRMTAQGITPSAPRRVGG